MRPGIQSGLYVAQIWQPRYNMFILSINIQKEDHNDAYYYQLMLERPWLH